jgi:hypothetical protein
MAWAALVLLMVPARHAILDDLGLTARGPLRAQGRRRLGTKRDLGTLIRSRVP